jgi:hypothetical protein
VSPGPRVVPKPAQPPEPAPAKLVWDGKTCARVACSLLLAWWGWVRYHDWPNANDSILHNLILPIHETGHIVFMAFGQYIYAAGGSIFQILFPAIFVVYFLRKGDRWAATVPLWFVGISAIDLVSYIKDAPYGEIELIGGEHDWSYLLGETRWMHAARQIGDGVLHFGGLCVLAALILGILWLPKSEPESTT